MRGDLRGFKLWCAGWIALAALPHVTAQPLRSLKTAPVPEPAGLAEYVAERAALVALGKALFWDMQAGSDGRTACATCHFHAGADHRIQNQIVDPNNPFPANARLSLGGFPLRNLVDPGDRNSAVIWDAEMRVGSAGLLRGLFEGVVPGRPVDAGTQSLDRPEFSVGGLQVRRVTVRNAPSVINAVHSVRNFWDGRAEREFNAADPFGDRSGSARPVLRVVDGRLEPHTVRLDPASLASQALGPVLDSLEMSYQGRTWPALGRKMLSLAPLAYQRVSTSDSVLGPMARTEGRGLAEGVTYLSMVRNAFRREFWEWLGPVAEAAGEYSQAEYNFPLFWGLAILAYESTLVSDDAPFDRFMDGDAGALSGPELAGMQIFQQNGRCTQCHGGAEFSAAGFSAAQQGRRGNAGRAFQRTGVRTAVEDGGRGNGNFRSIQLRNVELTGPFFHNGGQATLEQVIEFYSRGGDFAPNNLRPFNANATQRSNLVAFLKSLTDDRVRFERAPFDHPELCVPSGHIEEQPGVLQAGALAGFPRAAAERWLSVPAVGAGGNSVPLQDFKELLTGAGADGTRAHAMQIPCAAPLP
ncbi:MAG: cytochrome c peroxidase [Bryobacteraceae bacterium]